MFHSAHWIGVKLVSNWEQSMLHTKSQRVLNRKKMPMLTALKMSLTSKCVFYKPELNAKRVDPMELNFQGLEMKHTNGETSQSN